MLLPALIMPLVVLAALLYKGDFSAIKIAFGVSLIVAFPLMHIFTFALLRRRAGKVELRVTDQEIMLKGLDSSVKTMAFQDLTDVCVRKNKQGKVIWIKPATSSDKMTLAIFEEMDLLVDEIARRVPEGLDVRTEQNKIDWESPSSLYPFSVLLGVVGGGLLACVGVFSDVIFPYIVKKGIFQIIASLGCVVFGIEVLYKQKRSRALLKIAWGVSLVSIGTLNLVMELLRRFR